MLHFGLRFHRSRPAEEQIKAKSALGGCARTRCFYRSGIYIWVDELICGFWTFTVLDTLAQWDRSAYRIKASLVTEEAANTDRRIVLTCGLDAYERPSGAARRLCAGRRIVEPANNPDVALAALVHAMLLRVNCGARVRAERPQVSLIHERMGKWIKQPENCPASAAFSRSI